MEMSPSTYTLSAGISNLNLARSRMNICRKLLPPRSLEANDRTSEERLVATKMIAPGDERIATVLGILVIGKNPQDFLPGAYVQFLRIDGNELADDILDSEEIRGVGASQNCSAVWMIS